MNKLPTFVPQLGTFCLSPSTSLTTSISRTNLRPTFQHRPSNHPRTPILQMSTTPTAAPSKSSNSHPSPILEITTPEAYDTFIQNTPGLSVILFGAAWCRKCKYMRYQLKTMAKDFEDVHFAYLDANETAKIPQREDIRNMPTFIFYKGGERVAKLVGGFEVQVLTRKLRSFIDERRK